MRKNMQYGQFYLIPEDSCRVPILIGSWYLGILCAPRNRCIGRLCNKQAQISAESAEAGPVEAR